MWDVEEVLRLRLLRLLLVWIHVIVRALLFLLLSELIRNTTSISIIIMPVVIILYVLNIFLLARRRLSMRL